MINSIEYKLEHGPAKVDTRIVPEPVGCELKYYVGKQAKKEKKGKEGLDR